MPELPEVETIAKSLSLSIRDQIITNCWTSNFKMRSQLTEIERHGLIKQKVYSVDRVGKYLVVELSDQFLIIHFGMSGRLLMAKNLEETNSLIESLKHIHLYLSFENLFVLFYDSRRFGGFFTLSKRVAKTTVAVACHLNLGLEPLSDKFDAYELFKMTRSVKRNIKTFLLDGKKICGIGNIYATEALFRAGIRPSSPCYKLSLSRCSQLVACLKFVLLAAICKGGSSLRDFSGLHGERGSFVDEHLVYGKTENCIVCCRGLLRKSIGQRTTTFCLGCQK